MCATQSSQLPARKALMPPRIIPGLLGGVFQSIPEVDGSECVAHPPILGSPMGRSFFWNVRLRLKTDEELVADLLENEPDALTILFERHSALVFRIARKILRNDAEAEDAVQQVFLDMFRAAKQFDSEKSSFKSWLLMFTYHRTFNSRRQLRAHGFYDSDSFEDLPEELIQGAGCSLSFAPTEALILVEQVLSLIQPRQRRVIELTFYEGLTAEQASEVTGESVRVVRHNLYRGLERLRTVLCKSREEDQASEKCAERT
jgi:RNA polymerase sigma-70 factor (ECF subfamily)